MKIAVFGWYGHNNAGDERIKYCLTDFLRNIGGISSIDFYDFHAYGIKGKTNQFDNYDLVIIGGGGLIFSQCNYHDFINGINTKIITLGISIERPRLIGNVKKLAISLLEKSLVVLVRDQDSAQKLLVYDNEKKVKVSHDLTFLQPYETVSISNNNKVGVNLLPKPIHCKYSSLSIPFVSFLLRQLSRLGINNFVKIIDFKNMIEELKTNFEMLPIPLYCDPQINNIPLYQKNDVEFLKCYFKAVPQIFSDNEIDQCSIFLSMRLHGAIFAVQKGIPVVSLSYLPKNRNFMKWANLDELVIESIENKKVLTVIEYVQKNQSSIRNKMLTYKDMATSIIRKDLTEILNLIN